MKARKIVLVGAAVVVPLVVIAAGLLWLSNPTTATITIREPATAYDPDCSADRQLCAAWSEFRRDHPYPYQAFAAKKLADGTLAIVVSEPPPSLAKSELEKLVRTSFGSELLSMHRWRWMIGADGWVEDLIIQASPAQQSPAGSDPLDDATTRDRIALLQIALFGTAYGATVENIGNGRARQAVPDLLNLKIDGNQLRQWLADSSLPWRRTGDDKASSVSWQDLAKKGAVGAYTSNDATLSMLTFPISLISQARANPSSVNSLRDEFRRFAVSADVVLGGVWTDSGQAAIIARSRQLSLELMPPLRFETFALLLSQSKDELHQSYERNSLFAGKLFEGDQALKDWAPIYLSTDLVDTEFGALLNITDQMLKSWSQAGQIEYIYFAYPRKPGSFAFGEKPLSAIVKELNGSKSVLFNWNTAGATTAIRLANQSIVTIKQTGALPITYGAELKTGKMDTSMLLEYEKQAYDYFASVRDPNLARVVQYTLIYQLVRAIANDPSNPRITQNLEPPETSRGSDVLVKEAAAVLSDLQTGRLKNTDLEAKLRDYQTKHPTVNGEQLARILADPRSEASAIMIQQRELETLNNELRGKQEALERDRAAFNQTVQSLQAEITRYENSPSSNSALESSILTRAEALKAQKSALESRADALDEAYKPISQFAARQEALEDADGFRMLVRQEVSGSRNLDAVRRKYVDQNAAQPVGWIKTPSIVLSWNHESGGWVGGHDVNARVLRFEPSKDVSSIAVVETEKGAVVKYNPTREDAVGANAADISRAIEHEKISDTDKLESLLNRPVATPDRTAALLIPKPGEVVAPQDRWVARLGARAYAEKKAFVEDLRAMAEGNDCCLFVARDENQAAYLVNKNTHPPPASTVVQASDSPSLALELKAAVRSREGKPVVFLDTPPEHVKALTLDIPDTKPSDQLSRLSEQLGARKYQAADEHDLVLVDLDLLQRRTALAEVDQTRSVGGRDLFGRLKALFRRPSSWTPKDVQIRRLNATSTEALAKKAGWNIDKDGAPTAIAVSFDTKADQVPRLTVNVVAGFKQSNADQAASHLIDAHTTSIKAASNQGTVSQYLLTMKSQLQGLSGDQLKRLLFAIEDGETVTYFTQADHAASHHALL